MKNRSSTYLYKFKGSSNYFFRIRYGNFDRICHLSLKDKYFVASLRTSNYDHARWLALYIKCILIKDKDMNMNDVKKSTVYKLDTRIETMTKPGYTRALMGDLIPVPEELTPRYLLAQQQYKRQLRDKFRLLLATGKEIIAHGIPEQQLALLDPMSEDEIKKAKTDLDAYSEECDRRALVGALLPSSQINDSQLDIKYVHSISMLNQLVTVLKQESLKFDSYEDVAESSQKSSVDLGHSFSQQQLLSGMVDLLHLLPALQSVRNKVIKKTTVEEEAVQSHFSLFGQMEKFLKEKQGTIEDKTLTKYKASFNLLKDVFPLDSDVRVWKKQRVQQVKAKLTESKPSPKTRNMYLSNYRTLFTWIIDNTDADINNPFAKSAFPKSKGKLKRRSFNTEEVQKLLSYKPSHGSEARDFRRDANWYKKVCLYSSMRLNELSALPIANIKQIDGIWCFDLRGLNLKNEPSERVIPIAQYLLDLGIIDYVQTLKKEKETYFSPQIRHGKTKPGSAGWGDPISKWFNRTVLKKIGIDKEQELEKGSLICFHCTRRTFISTCVSNGEEKYLVKRLAGHSVDDDITLGVYSDLDQIDLKLLKDVIDRNLKWHESESR